jgi:hypothetical protein
MGASLKARPWADFDAFDGKEGLPWRAREEVAVVMAVSPSEVARGFPRPCGVSRQRVKSLQRLTNETGPNPQDFLSLARHVALGARRLIKTGFRFAHPKCGDERACCRNIRIIHIVSPP